MAKKEGDKGKRAVVPAEVLPPLSPFAAFEREIDRWFDDVRRFMGPSLFERFGVPRLPRGQLPPVDVYEEKDHIVVKAELPGMTKDDLAVSLKDTTLTITGEKKREKETKGKDYYRSEREYGSFARTVELPVEVKPEEVAASFKDGILEIRLPKTEAAKRKPIKVQVQ